MATFRSKFLSPDRGGRSHFSEIAHLKLDSDVQLMQYEGRNPPQINVGLSNFEHSDVGEIVTYMGYAVPQALAKDRRFDLKWAFVDSVEMGRKKIDNSPSDPRDASIMSRDELYREGEGKSGIIQGDTFYINEDQYKQAQQVDQFTANVFVAVTASHEMTHAYIDPVPSQSICNLDAVPEEQRSEVRREIIEAGVSYIDCKIIEGLTDRSDILDILDNAGLVSASQVAGYEMYNSLGQIVGQNDVFNGLASGTWSFADNPQVKDVVRDIFDMRSYSDEWAVDAARDAMKFSGEYLQHHPQAPQDIYFDRTETTPGKGDATQVLLRDISGSIDIQAQLMVDSAQLIQTATPDAKVYISPGGGIEKYVAGEQGMGVRILPLGVFDFRAGESNQINPVGDLFCERNVTGAKAGSMVALLDIDDELLVSPNEAELKKRKYRLRKLEDFSHIQTNGELEAYLDEYHPESTKYEKFLVLRAITILLKHKGLNPLQINPSLIAEKIHKLAAEYQRANLIQPTLKQIAEEVARFINARYSEKVRDRFSTYRIIGHQEFGALPYMSSMEDCLVLNVTHEKGLRDSESLRHFINYCIE